MEVVGNGPQLLVPKTGTLKECQECQIIRKVITGYWDTITFIFHSMPKNLLETHRIHVSISDLEMCFETIKLYNPWFPSDEN